MRILLVSNFYPPYWVGGYEQIAAWVAEGLGQRGHQVLVLTGRGPALDGRPDVRGTLDLDLAALWERYFTTGLAAGGGLVRALRDHVFSLRNFDAAASLMGDFRPDLVSFWNPAFITFSPLLAARLAGLPRVLHVSDTVANPFRNPHPPAFPPSLRGLGRGAVDVLLRLARPDLVLVPSAFLRAKLVAREGLLASRLEVLHWPVEPTISRISAAPRGVGPALLFVGTLIPEKGADVLLQAFRMTHAERPELRLTLVGAGPDAFERRLRAMAAGLPVRFTGRLDRAAVVEAYAGHDILAFPSTWEEPYAVVTLEAMAMGLAVIATNAGGTPEAIEDGRTGLLVPPGDPLALSRAILRLAGDPALGRRLAQAGQIWARAEQGFDTFLDRLERLYRAVAGA